VGSRGFLNSLVTHAQDSLLARILFTFEVAIGDIGTHWYSTMGKLLYTQTKDSEVTFKNL